MDCLWNKLNAFSQTVHHLFSWSKPLHLVFETTTLCYTSYIYGAIRLAAKSHANGPHLDISI